MTRGTASVLLSTPKPPQKTMESWWRCITVTWELDLGLLNQSFCLTEIKNGFGGWGWLHVVEILTRCIFSPYFHVSQHQNVWNKSCCTPHEGGMRNGEAIKLTVDSWRSNSSRLIPNLEEQDGKRQKNILALCFNSLRNTLNWCWWPVLQVTVWNLSIQPIWVFCFTIAKIRYYYILYLSFSFSFFLKNWLKKQK